MPAGRKKWGPRPKREGADEQKHPQGRDEGPEEPCAPTFRAFVAIEPGEEIRRFLGEEQARLKEAGLEEALRAVGARVRWVDPAQIHLTIRFLGNITGERAQEVVAAMKRAARSIEPFELIPAGLNAKPRPGAPQVIWTELADRANPARLEAALSTELKGLGIEPEARPFRGHLTLARVKWKVRPSVSQDVTRILQNAGVGDDPSPEKERVAESPLFVVYTYSLFASELTSDGPLYTERARVALGSGREQPTREGVG